MSVVFEGQPVQECWFCGYENPCRPDVWNKRPACEQCWHQVKEETRGWRKLVEDGEIQYTPGEVAAYMQHAMAIWKAGHD